MIIPKKLTKKQAVFILIGLVVLLFQFKLYRNAVTTSGNELPGYFDIEERIQVLDGIKNFTSPFKEYWISKGVLQNLFMLPTYMLLGANYNSLFITIYIVLPIISLVLTYLAFGFFLKGFAKYAAVGVVYVYTISLHNYDSIRFLYPVWALAYFHSIVRDSANDKAWYKFFSAGLVIGMGFLMSIEYGVVVIGTIFISLAFSQFFRSVRLNFRALVLILAGLIFPIIFYITPLVLNGTLPVVAKSMYGGISDFQYSNPCADAFPKFWRAKVVTFQSIIATLRYYLPPVLYLTLFVLAIFKWFRGKRHLENSFIVFSLIIFGVFAYKRTLVTPCDGYYLYGTPPLIALIYFVIQVVTATKRRLVKVGAFFGVTMVFVILMPTYILTTINTSIFKKLAGPGLADTKVYYDKIGYPISVDIKNQYEEISKYIMANTSENDPLFVYPTGIYNKLTERPKATAINSTFMFQGEPTIVKYTLSQLNAHKPKYIIINTYNNLGVVIIAAERKDTPLSFYCADALSPCFAGRGSEIERWLIENYELEKQWKVASVFKLRPTPIKYIETQKTVFDLKTQGNDAVISAQGFVRTEPNFTFTPLTSPASITFTFPQEKSAEFIDITATLNNSLVKTQLSIHRIYVIVHTATGPIQYVFKAFGREQVLQMGFTAGETAKIKAIEVKLSENMGMSDLLPDSLFIDNIRLYNESTNP